MALSSQLGGRVEDPPCVQGFMSLAGQSPWSCLRQDAPLPHAAVYSG